MRAPIDPRLVRRADATKVYLLTGVAAGTATAVLVLLQAQLLSRSIATVFSRHSLDGLTAPLIGLAAVLAGRGLLSWLNAWSAQRTAAAVKSQLRQDIMASRLNRPIRSTTTSSTLVTLVTQGLDALDGYFSKYLPQLLLAVTVPLILGVAILARDLGSAVIIAATIPFIPLLMALVGIKTQESVEKRWRFQTRLANHFADLVAGLPTLQVFSRARAQAAGLRRTEAANRRATMGILRISFLSALVLELFSTLAVAVVAVTIGTRLCTGGMDFQTALFVLILAPEVYLPIRQVGVHYHDSADGLAAAEAAFAEIDGLAEAVPGQPSSGQSASGRPAPDRSSSVQPAGAGTPPTGSGAGSDGAGTPPAGVDAQAAGADASAVGVGASPPTADARTGETGPRPVRTDTSPAESGGRPAEPGAVPARPTGGDALAPPRCDTIRARGLGYSYPGAAGPALAPVDLDLGPGQVVALAGRSGGGKTTLLNLVLGFLAPTVGDLDLGGVAASRVDLAAWRRRLAYVPQTPGLVEGSIADNVRFGLAEAAPAQIRAALERAGAARLDPERLIGDDGQGLSAGERRRVGLARALLRIEAGDARVLLLDEPTAGLDADAEAWVLSSLRASGAAALVVSHRPAVLAAADRVVQIDPPPPTSTAGTAVEADPGAAVSGRLLADSAAAENTAPPAVSGRAVEVSSPAVEVSPSAAPGTPGPGRAAADLAPPPAVSGSAPGRAADSASSPAPRPQGFFIDFANPLAQPKQDLLDQPEDEAEAILSRGRSPLWRLVRSLLRAVPRGRSRLLAAVLLAFVAAGSSVALMGISAWLISRAAERPDFLQLTVAAAGVRACAIARAVGRYVERLVGHDLALRLQSALRLRTYARLARTTLLGRSRGDLLVRVVADVAAIEEVVVRVVLPFAAAAMVVLATCGLIAWWSWPVALVYLVSAVLGGVVVPWLTQRVSLRADRQAAPLRGQLGAIVHSLSRTAPDLAAYGLAAPALERLRATDARLRAVEAKAAWAQGLGAGLQQVAAGLAVLGGLWLGSQAVAGGGLRPTMVAVFVLTPLALHEVFANFAQAAQSLTRAGAALGRVTAILEAPPVGQGDAPLTPLQGSPGVKLTDVAVGWPGNASVVAGVELELGPGQSLAVIGPSGIGKTTLAATIMGLIPAQRGTVEVSGRIGYLAQDAHIFATTVAENVRIGDKDASDQAVRAALARAGLPGFDPDRVVGEFGATLSGGEARRLALARLDVGVFDWLILDEPTEHLDRETADALMDDIWARLDRRPVLVVSHDESLAARCDAVLDLTALAP